VNLPLDACGQIKRLPGFEALDVFQHVPRVRFGRRLAQPASHVTLLPSLRLSSSRR
jgi:hypothetical protein